MMRNKKYFQIDIAERVADINIYGTITSFDYWSDEISAKSFKEQVDELDVDTINVYINSPGGEVGEALAIYSTLKRHKATVNTFCDGFACSAASIIFCAGDIRTMGAISMLMIHNCMSYIGYANSAEMRKAADDNDKINQSSIEAYKAVSNLDEDTIKQLMDDETWITASESLEYGFATEIAEDENNGGVQQSVNPVIHQMILDTRKQNDVSLQQVISHIDEIAEKFDSFVEELKHLKQSEGEPANQVTNGNNPFKNFFTNLK